MLKVRTVTSSTSSTIVILSTSSPNTSTDTHVSTAAAYALFAIPDLPDIKPGIVMLVFREITEIHFGAQIFMHITVTISGHQQGHGPKKMPNLPKQRGPSKPLASLVTVHRPPPPWEKNRLSKATFWLIVGAVYAIRTQMLQFLGRKKSREFWGDENVRFRHVFVDNFLGANFWCVQHQFKTAYLNLVELLSQGSEPFRVCYWFGQIECIYIFCGL